MHMCIILWIQFILIRFNEVLYKLQYYTRYVNVPLSSAGTWTPFHHPLFKGYMKFRNLHELLFHFGLGTFFLFLCFQLFENPFLIDVSFSLSYIINLSTKSFLSFTQTDKQTQHTFFYFLILPLRDHFLLLNFPPFLVLLLRLFALRMSLLEQPQ